MKITILCSSKDHPVNAYIQRWAEAHKATHSIDIIRSRYELTGGDLLFLISCSEIIKAPDRDRYKKTLVIHASDLPQGRGWSPHVWQIIDGATEITVSLIEAEDLIDSGDIWHKVKLQIPKTALYEEINDLLFLAELSLMDFAVENFKTVIPTKQSNAVAASYHPKRSPKDSEIDPHRTIAEQFDLIRVCDTDRYPAHFLLHGQKYVLKLEKAKIEDEPKNELQSLNS